MQVIEISIEKYEQAFEKKYRNVQSFLTKVLIFLKNRNGRKRKFQMKETREVIILLYYT